MARKRHNLGHGINHLAGARLLPHLAILAQLQRQIADVHLRINTGSDRRVSINRFAPRELLLRFLQIAIADVFRNRVSENVLKCEPVHPSPGVYNFGPADAYVAFGERHHMFITGHTLVWHSQTPRWVFEDVDGKPLSRDALLARLRDHIFAVVGRYKGRIGGWDVVNEALNDDGTMRASPWQRIIGDDFAVKAFQWAHEADPTAELYYNDYNLATPAKRDGAVALVKRIQAARIPVAAIGSQDHHNLDWPSAALVDSMFTVFRRDVFDMLEKLAVLDPDYFAWTSFTV